MEQPYMVSQTIKYSDGTETIINYTKEQGMEPENTEEVAPEVVEESAPLEHVEAAEETPAESVEETA